MSAQSFFAASLLVSLLALGCEKPAESARVIAERQALVMPDGTRKVMVSSVVLHPR
jgi:hypothetical protein